MFLFRDKGKVRPKTGHEGPEGEQGYTSTLALDGAGCQCYAPAALPPGKTQYTFYRRLGGSQSRSGQVRKISPPPGFDPRTVQPVASRYTDYAIPALNCFSLLNIIKQKTWKRHGEASSTHREDEKFVANLGIKLM